MIILTAFRLSMRLRRAVRIICDRRTAVLVVVLLGCSASEHASCGECEVQRLAVPGEPDRALFGWSTALQGDTLVASAVGQDIEQGYSRGAVYLYQHNGTGWVEAFRLTSSDGAEHDSFGYSVDRSGDTIVASASSDDDLGQDSGSAYIFESDGESWNETKILAPDGASSDHFGRSVAIDGDIALIGADGDDDFGSGSGSAYVFRRYGSGWAFEQKLLAEDAHKNGRFGMSVALEGEIALIGAYGYGDLSDDPGAAYVFQFDSNSGEWTQKAKITASDGEWDDSFGRYVAMSGEVIVIGAPETVTNRPGMAYIYRYDAGGDTWVEEAKLEAVDGGNGDRFGYRVAVCGDAVIIAACYDDDHGTNSGSAYYYRFDPDESKWIMHKKLVPEDGMEWAEFGYAVALDGDIAVIGAPRDSEIDEESGAAYVYDLSTCPYCEADLNGDETVDVLDLLLLLAAWGECPPRSNECPADIVADGEVDVLDLLQLLSQWGEC